jgi:hypothetical protein
LVKRGRLRLPMITDADWLPRKIVVLTIYGLKCGECKTTVSHTTRPRVSKVLRSQYHRQNSSDKLDPNKTIEEIVFLISHLSRKNPKYYEVDAWQV